MLKINDDAINFVSELAPALMSSKNAWRISIRREGQVLTTEIKG